MKVKNIFKALSVAALAVAAASCSVSEEMEKYDEITVHQKYYAQIEDPSDPGARTYADGDLKVLWNADDRVSIFSKNTYNQQYRFDGQTGDNSGSFSVVQDPGYVTGNELPYSYSVYPYSESTTISNAGVITMTLPATQTYAVESFGPGDNAMVAVAEGNVIVYKNLGGYLMFKLYGEGITVSSISLKGNNGELLSGTAAVEMPLGGVPSLEFAPATAGTEITLNCATPVALGSSAESYTAFWFVLPPVTFSKGITITVTEGDGTVFTKTTGGSFSISRNKRSRMAPLQVEPGTALTPPDNEIWYTSTDGNIVTPYSAEAFDANIVSNTYENGKGVIKFDGSLTSLNQQAFYSKTTLASILLPHSVRNISVLALSNTALTQVVLHDGVQMIDNGAFSHNSSLKKVTLPQNVFNLGDNPFSDCGSLESFEGCFASEDGRCLIHNGRLLSFAPAGLTGYTVPEGITEIKTEVFYNYTNLTSINLPSSLQIIGGSVFRNCTFTEIELPEGLKSIGGLAFWNCKNLTEITIPESVTTIYDWAFRYCTSLNSITCLPSTPPSGAELMFDDTNDCPIYVPAGSVDAYKAAEYWSNYAERIQAIPAATPPNNEIWYTSTDGNIVTPNDASGFGVNMISNIYEDGKGIMRFDGTLTTIGSSAFTSVKTLQSITLPSSVTSIQSRAFMYSTNLSTVQLNNGLQTIGSYAFNCVSALQSIAIPSSVTEVQNAAFMECNNLQSFEGDHATADGRFLVIDDVLCGFAPKGITEVVIPEGIKTIQDFLFQWCYNIKDVTLPSTLVRVGSHAFYECYALESVSAIPTGVQEIGTGAFKACLKLSSFSGKYATDDGQFLIIDNTLLAFAPKDKENVVIPGGIESVAMQAFSDDYLLKTVVLPATVTRLGSYAFCGCSGLTAVTINSATVPSAYNVFEDTNNCPIYVPAESVDAYKAADGWSTYADRIQAISQPNNEIWYTTTDGSTVQIANESVLNVGVVSNTYENGKGIIKLDGDLTRIGTIKDGYSSNSDAFLDGTTSSSGARKLKSISFPQSLDVICTWTLLSCKKLESIILPDHLSYLGGGAVDGCTSLTTVAVPDCDEIRYNPFDWCTGIESFSGPQASADGQFIIKNGTIHSYATAGRTQCSIPEGVSSIASNAFNGATIEELSLPSSLESISNSFVGMSQLKRINFSEGLKTIGMHAFEYCSSLTGVTLPESLELLDYAAFASCTSLSQIQIPSGTVIPMNPFAGCSSLASFSGKYASSDGRYLADGTKLLSIAPAGLTSFAVPEGIEVLDWDLFAGCNFVSITIPEGVTTVNCGCFSNCTSLTSLTMPSTWVQYDGALLYNCKSLEKLVSYAATPPTNRMNSTNTFLFNTNNCPIYVPAGAVDAYKAAAVWSDFADRIKPLGEMYETVDLGLPSGAKWASFNVGASSPEGYGYYYAWGETAPKAEYSWSTYRFGEERSLTKYCNTSGYGKDGFTDALTQLEYADDVVRQMLGGNWVMPTHDDWIELKENCTWSWTTQNGVSGLLIVSKNNDNTLFLPGAGEKINNEVQESGQYGYYWSSSYYGGPYGWGAYVRFDGLLDHNSLYRPYGMSVRPVKK